MTAERVIVVGGGVLGTMHALAACRRGFEVLHLEQDTAPRRASIRNFGLVWVSGRAAGDELGLALRARELWEAIAAEAPDVGFRPDGSMTVATNDAELRVLSELAGGPDAAERGVEVLDPPAARAVNPALRGEFLGALHCRRDAVVEPGAVLGAVRSLCSRDGRYNWRPGRSVVSIEPGVATDHLGERHEASLVICCPGAAHAGIGGLVGEALRQAPLRRCRLHMLQTLPLDERIPTAIADGDSMRYYPAFDLPSRPGLPAPDEATRRWGMQLLLVQRRGGELTIGDTHEYDEPFDFALDEAAGAELLRRATAVLGRPLPPVARRWAGVYSAATDDRACVRVEPAPGLVAVTGPAGRGMTLSPAIAEQTFEAR